MKTLRKFYDSLVTMWEVMRSPEAIITALWGTALLIAVLQYVPQ